MNFYEHTLIARQDVSPSQIKQIQEKIDDLDKKFDENKEILEKIQKRKGLLF